MTAPTKPTGVQAYQVVLYSRALHPELFELKGRNVLQHADYELESWLMPGAHLLRLGRGELCITELVTDREGDLPDTGIVTAFLCAGERDYEHKFERGGVTYMTTVQTETLSENLYLSTFREMRAHARDNESIAHQWDDASGPNLSLLDVQRINNELHVQSYHLIAHAAFVLRTQSIFEIG